jgi:hypothetical protein
VDRGHAVDPCTPSTSAGSRSWTDGAGLID